MVATATLLRHGEQSPLRIVIPRVSSILGLIESIRPGLELARCLQRVPGRSRELLRTAPRAYEGAELREVLPPLRADRSQRVTVCVLLPTSGSARPDCGVG